MPAVAHASVFPDAVPHVNVLDLLIPDPGSF